MTKLPRGIRNFNPGNINFANQKGFILETGVDDPRFATPSPTVYPTEEAKAFAGLSLLRDQLIRDYTVHKQHTVSDIISSWAPPTENNTKAYISGVAHSVGVEANTILPALTPAIITGMMNAIIRYENGYNPYGENVSKVANAVDYTNLKL